MIKQKNSKMIEGSLKCKWKKQEVLIKMSKESLKFKKKIEKNCQ